MTIDERKQHREQLEAMVPQAITALGCIMGPRPPRNAQSLLAAALAVLNRTGFPAQTESKVIGDAGQPLQSKLVVEFVRAGQIVEAKPVREIE